MNIGSKLKFQYKCYESLLLNKLNNYSTIDDWSKINTIFIISTGRTGTHFFSHFFNNLYSNIHSIHEPKQDVFDLNIKYFYGKISHNKAKDMIRNFRHNQYQLLIKNNISNYIESNNNLSFLIPLLQEIFPKSKFIHIIRNGKDVVRSMYSKRTYGKWVGEALIYSKSDPRDRLSLDKLNIDSYHRNIWKNFSRFEKCCWAWATKDLAIYNLLNQNSSSIQLKFEDLFVLKNMNSWHKLLDFCDLKETVSDKTILEYLTISKSNESKAFKIGKYDDWNTEYKNHFKLLAGKHMSRLGYKI